MMALRRVVSIRKPVQTVASDAGTMSTSECCSASGSVRLVDGRGTVTQVFQSPHFDLLSHLRCEVVLAFAGLLNAKKIGSDLYYDETLATCPDYDFWIRLGCRFDHTDFVVAPDVFKTARADRASMSYRAEAFPQFCSDKLLASLCRFRTSRTKVRGITLF